MIKGLEALERLMANYYEMCQDLGNNDDQYQRCNLTSERAIIEKELKALAILIYWYQPNIIHDLFCLGASDEEINLVREVLKE